MPHNNFQLKRKNTIDSIKILFYRISQKGTPVGKIVNNVDKVNWSNRPNQTAGAATHP